MKKRLLSLILCFALMLSLLSCIGPVIPVRAATANQNNIVDRADYLYNITWLCQKTVYGWCGNYVFNAGTAYRLPYGQPINACAYIGYGVSVDSFISAAKGAAKDASSVFYSSRSTYGTTNSVYYATDCSAFVSWCWGIDRKTTYSIPLTSGVTYIGMATAANTAQLQLGDCLNSNDVGHVVLVTDLAYNSSGNLTQIEITEQTPPQLKRSYYTPSELGSKYGGYYGIYRYSGTVPAAPNAFTTKYYPACGSSYTSLYPALESIGVYYYTYATSVAGAQTDANNMLQWIKGKTFEYPIYFDYEDSSQDSLSSTTAKNICLTFCDAMAAAGYLTGIYTGYYKSTQLPIDAICAKYEIWIANYWDYTYETLSSGYSTKYGMYQYTDRNYIGSNGPYDGDVAFKDYPAIVKKYGFNGYADPDAYFDQCTFYPAHCQVKTAKTTSVNTLPCAKNTNGSVQVLSAEADQTFTAIGMYRNTSENLWYQVVLDGGEIAYLYSGHCTFVQELQTDLSLKDSTVPGNLKDGESFGVKGTLEAAYHQLQEVKITVYSEGSPVAGGSEQITGHVYSLEGSDLAAAIDFATLTPGSYLYEVSCTYHSYYAAAEKEPAVIQGTKVLLQSAFIVQECEHSYTSKLVQAATCTKEGILKQTCDKCGKTFQSTIVALGHRYESMQVEATCTEPGGTGYTCQTCGDSFLVETVQPLGHRYSEGKCSNCGEADPGLVVTQPTLTLKSPTLEFKDMITVNAFFTAQNTENVVEMGMITYEEKVGAVSVDTADHVIPGTTYDENTGRYCARSQGIHAKYLGDTVYLAVYAKLTDGSYVYTKLAPYSPVQYATNQLKNSTDVKLKKLVAAMLNYGAEAQLYFGHNTGSLANASLNSDQKAMPEVYRADMVKAVPAASAAKQGVFANNSGFSSRKPAISFEGAFCINYFFTPRYAPSSGITLYYWNEADYNAVQVLTAANATGKLKLEGSGIGEYRGDITGISAKNLSEAVYVAAAYKDADGNVWTSGVLGYSIGSYCTGQAAKGTEIAALAMATTVYGYHAKQYFG